MRKPVINARLAWSLAILIVVVGILGVNAAAQSGVSCAYGDEAFVLELVDPTKDGAMTIEDLETIADGLSDGSPFVAQLTDIVAEAQARGLAQIRYDGTGACASGMTATSGTPVATSDEGAIDQRLSDLETRVAALETQVAGSPPASAPGPQGGSSSTSNSSSSSSSTNSYTATYSGTGDRQIEVEVNDPGTYQLTATTTSAFSATLDDAAGNPLTDFAITTEGSGTVTASGPLEAGAYVLRVSATSTWSITVILLMN